MATGEHCHNRVMFKQFLQADALQFCQIDCCRLAGPNEILSVLLMASKFGGKDECNNLDINICFSFDILDVMIILNCC